MSESPYGGRPAHTPDEKAYEQAKFEAIVARKKWPVQLAGQCAGCGRGIPVGFVAKVTEWTTELRGLIFRGEVYGGGFSAQVPKVMYCGKCPASGGLRDERSISRRRAVRVPVGDTPLKDIAARMIKAMSQKPRSVYRIARKSGFEYSDVIPAILQKLQAAGKVEMVEVEGKPKWKLP